MILDFTPAPEKPNNGVAIGVGVGVGVLVLIIIVVVAVCMCKKKSSDAVAEDQEMTANPSTGPMVPAVKN